MRSDLAICGHRPRGDRHVPAAAPPARLGEAEAGARGRRRPWRSLALILFAAFWTPPRPLLTSLFFYGFSFAAVAGGLLTITSRDPIHSALWFAVGGALDLGPVPPGRGAVPRGGDGHRLRRGDHRDIPVRDHAGPDGRPGALRPRGAGAGPRDLELLPALLGLALRAVPDQAPGATAAGDRPRATTSTASENGDFARLGRIAGEAGIGHARSKPGRCGRRRSSTIARAGRSRTSPALGETLYTDHLITVELAGALLFAALIGALAIAAPKPPVRPGRCARPIRCPTTSFLTRRETSFAMPPADPFTFEILRNYLLVGAALMVLGMLGFLARRNLIVMFLSAEMMLQGTALTLVGFGRYHGNWTGQVFTIVILTVAACEASIALALILVLFNRRSSLDVTLWQEIREPGQPPIVGRRRARPSRSRPSRVPRRTRI